MKKLLYFSTKVPLRCQLTSIRAISYCMVIRRILSSTQISASSKLELRTMLKVEEARRAVKTLEIKAF